MTFRPAHGACALALLAAVWPAGLMADPPAALPDVEAAARGYRILTEKPYLTPDFDQETFDALWQTWEEPLRSQAEAAGVDERRRMAFERYGLTPAAGRESPVALQYVDDGGGGWVMNCFACHGGKVAGEAVPGAPNSLYALQTLTEEVRATKLRLDKPLARMDVGSLFMPLGTTNGTTNSVMFGVALMALRDADLNVLSRSEVRPPPMLHHDDDAPPWWNVRKRSRLYVDGFVQKGHRALMQFVLVPQNGPEKFREWESDYRDVLAYIESVEPPAYRWDVDEGLAAVGSRAFARVCSECHGRYGDEESYPERIVPIDVVGTDGVRLAALTPEMRANYGRSWFGQYGRERTLDDPGGYLAPPLDGIWASAPYFHNGSVPTLWHVLHPAERPVVWRRTADGYDRQRVGLEIAAFDRLPTDVATPAERRTYFDTRALGKSAAGHDFAEQLSAEERAAVLEYLKTL